MKKTFLLSLILLKSLTVFGSVESSICPSVAEIHQAEHVDHVWYVSGLLQPYDNNRYIIRITGALYTRDGHKYSIWTEPFGAATDKEAKEKVEQLLPSLSGPYQQPKETWWKDELCWYRLKDGTYVVGRFWW